MQELRCSCKVEVAASKPTWWQDQRLSPALQRWVSGLCKEGNGAAAVEAAPKQPICPDGKGYGGTSHFTAFWGVYLGVGVHRSRFPNAFKQTSCC